MPGSQVPMNGQSEVTEAQRIDSRDQSGPKFALYFSLGIQLPHIFHTRSPQICASEARIMEVYQSCADFWWTSAAWAGPLNPIFSLQDVWFVILTLRIGIKWLVERVWWMRGVCFFKFKFENFRIRMSFNESEDWMYGLYNCFLVEYWKGIFKRLVQNDPLEAWRYLSYFKCLLLNKEERQIMGAQKFNPFEWRTDLF